MRSLQAARASLIVVGVVVLTSQAFEPSPLTPPDFRWS